MKKLTCAILLILLLSTTRAFAFWIFSKEKAVELKDKTGQKIEKYKEDRKKKLKEKRIEKKKKSDLKKEKQANLKKFEKMEEEDNFKFIKYNEPAGSNELDFFGIYGKRQISTKGVVSPNYSKLAYTEVHFYPSVKQVTSEIFLINLSHQKRVKRRVLDAHIKNRRRINFYRSGMKKVEDQIFRTLTIVDWSNDSNKILVKERIAENLKGFISTTTWVYDIQEDKTYLMKDIRKNVIDHYLKKGIKLNNYRWDIKPMGWFKYQPDRILVNAYGYKKDKSKTYLGTWLVGYKDGSIFFLSEKENEYPCSAYGLILKKINNFTN